jgi:hypothetical protein
MINVRAPAQLAAMRKVRRVSRPRYVEAVSVSPFRDRRENQIAPAQPIRAAAASANVTKENHSRRPDDGAHIRIANDEIVATVKTAKYCDGSP